MTGSSDDLSSMSSQSGITTGNNGQATMCTNSFEHSQYNSSWHTQSPQVDVVAELQKQLAEISAKNKNLEQDKLFLERQINKEKENSTENTQADKRRELQSATKAIINTSMASSSTKSRKKRENKNGPVRVFSSKCFALLGINASHTHCCFCL
jgi:hypothetical protein